jgi:DNA-binding transcriptional ArsR family regulator
MVVDSPTERDADRLFHALADATRRDIVERAMQQDHSVSELARCYPMSFAAVQKHVAVLERARLVTKHRRGREQLVRCNIDAIRAAHRLLDHFEAVWRGRMNRFGDVLADLTEGATP